MPFHIGFLATVHNGMFMLVSLLCLFVIHKIISPNMINWRHVFNIFLYK